ncbi:MacS family sensor histidine kinase [Nocardioides sp.]|uniref:MacS family sensor histidine kinase n=1 Tax=Nocardioides sp. TaxID=35761 RepID=UPI003565F2B5
MSQLTRARVRLARLGTTWFGPALNVEDRLFRWLGVLRVIVAINAIGLYVYRADNVQRPVLGAVCAAAMVVWTGVAIWAYVAPVRRGPLLLGADLAIAAGLIAMSPVVKGAGFSATIPGFWVMGALIAWAIHWRWIGGLAAGLALTATDLLSRQELTQTNYGNAFLLVLGGTIVGFMGESLQLMAADRDRAQRAAAAEHERARLARAVHDGVLQVLALVQRRSTELGPDGAALGRLAGEQEAALRTLIRAQDAFLPDADEGLVEVGQALLAFAARSGVEVATPGVAVELPAGVATELIAAVGACLDNSAAHAGPDVRCWVLLEALSDRVEVSVRDDGPGIAPGRLGVAEAEGRLGVSASIRGRMAALGGTATLNSGPDGTEWELAVPRAPTHTAR